MNQAQWPSEDRPREKLLGRGAASLSDTELLALVLQTGVQGQSALQLANSLLAHFGSLPALLAAQLPALCRMHGLGPAKAARLVALAELHKRQLLAVVKSRDTLTSSAATRDYLRLRFGHASREVFCCLFLSSQHQVLELEELFHGTIDGAAVYPREVVKSCLSHNAAAVIFAHNHPSGVTEPSQADIAITKRLRAALSTIDVRVLDHLVVGADRVVSFAERGLL